MCLFTHFAAGALVGGISGQAVIAILGGFATHVLLDALPHYDFPNWRIELTGGLGALLVLLSLPQASWPAVLGGLAGMLPDLENLLWKLGKISRRAFIFPSHTGWIPHGRKCRRGNLAWQLVLTAACFALLGWLSPSTAAAAATTPAAAPAAISPAQWTVPSSSDAATVIRMQWSVRDRAGGLQQTDLVAGAELPPQGLRLLGPEGDRIATPLEHRFAVALPRYATPTWRLAGMTWVREPTIPVPPEQIVFVSHPVLFRGVPLATVVVRVQTPGGGILSSLQLVIEHPPAGRFADFLAAADVLSPDAQPAAHLAPADVINPDLFRALRRGQRAWSSAHEKTAAAVEAHPLNRSSHWVRLPIVQTGVYGFSGMELSLLGVPPADVDVGTLRLFKGGGRPVDANPDSLQSERVGFREVAIAVEDDDGDWDSGDRILFYAFGGDAWADRLDPDAGPLASFEHPYQREGIYWLTWEDAFTPSPFAGPPSRIATVSLPAHDGVAPATTFRQRRHFEQSGAEATGVVADNWAWDTLVFGRRDLNFQLADAAAGGDARFVIDIRSVALRASRLAYENHASAWLNSDQASAVSIDWTLRDQNDSLRVRLIGSSNALQTGANTLRLLNANLPDADYGTPALALALDAFDVLYTAPLVKGQGALHCAHWRGAVAYPDTPVNFRIQHNETDVRVWDVTRPEAVTEVVGTAGMGDPASVTLGLLRQPETSRHFLVFSEADILTPDRNGTRRHYPSGLTINLGPTDYVAIYDERFVGPATELVGVRAAILPGAVGNPAAAAVDAQDVYDYFSGGLKDPLALRNFLRWLFQATDGSGTDHELRFACLIGDASRDYRNYLNHDPDSQLYDFLPTIVRTEFPVDPHQGGYYNEPYATDDGLVSFDPPAPGMALDIPDLAIGRLTARNRAEAQAMVERIVAYVSNPEPGAWRNRVVMAADDLDGPNHLGQDDHMVWADSLVNGYIPATLDIEKVYLLNYAKAPGSQYKPGARLDAKRFLNEGTTIFHYIGHGGDNVLADEQVLLIDDIYTLGNDQRRGVFLAFSCDVGIYDSPVSQSMAEVFVSQANGGAIASICASQVSWIDTNEILSGAFYRNLYPQQRAVPASTLGEALQRAKFDVGESFGQYPRYLHNSQRYGLFGDPALHLPNPASSLVFAPASADTLRGGAREIVALQLSAQDVSLGPGVTYDLRVEEAREDKNITVDYRNSLGEIIYSLTVNFWLAGATVFRGTGGATEDELRIPFKVPVQLHYGERGRIRLILDSPTGSWAGVMQPPVVAAGVGPVDDVAGPDIHLSFADNRYRVRAGTALRAALSDTSGISILGTKPGNSINLEFDDSGILSDVSNAFIFDAGHYTQGQLAVPLPDDLDLGAHQASLYASDVLGNVGSDTISFLLVAEGVASIEDATVFPNPTPGPCRLVFEISDPMRVEWSIYTLAGRRLKMHYFEYATPGPKIIEWDGRDNWGDEIANGVYIYVLRGSWDGNEGHDLKQTGQVVIMK
jgi:hypothetical protein